MDSEREAVKVLTSSHKELTKDGALANGGRPEGRITKLSEEFISIVRGHAERTGRTMLSEVVRDPLALVELSAFSDRWIIIDGLLG